MTVSDDFGSDLALGFGLKRKQTVLRLGLSGPYPRAKHCVSVRLTLLCSPQGREYGLAHKTTTADWDRPSMALATLPCLRI